MFFDSISINGIGDRCIRFIKVISAYKKKYTQVVLRAYIISASSESEDQSKQLDQSSDYYRNPRTEEFGGPINPLRKQEVFKDLDPHDRKCSYPVVLAEGENQKMSFKNYLQTKIKQLSKAKEDSTHRSVSLLVPSQLHLFQLRSSYKKFTQLQSPTLITTYEHTPLFLP